VQVLQSIAEPGFEPIFFKHTKASCAGGQAKLAA